MLIVRFSDRRSLGQWVGSDERRSLTAEAASFSKEVYEERGVRKLDHSR